MRGTAKSESEQKMKMVWGRVLLLAATVAGLEVAIEDYFGDVTFLQGEHRKKKKSSRKEQPLIKRLGKEKRCSL